MKSIALSPDSEKFIISYPPTAAARVVPNLKHYFIGHSYNRAAGVYEVPAQLANAGRLLQFAKDYSFAIHETARRRFDKMHIAANLNRTFPGRIVREGVDKKGRPAIHVKTDEFVRAIYDRVSAMAGAEYVNQYKAWAVPPSEACHVQKLADDFQFTVDPATHGWLEVEAAKERKLANAGIRRRAALLEAAKDIPRGSFGGKTPRDYQVLGVSFLIDAFEKYGPGSGALLADDMGCISGDAILKINRCGRGMQMTLRELFKRFDGQSKRWKNYPPIYSTTVKSMAEDGALRHNEIKNVLFQGVKPTFEVKTINGKSIRATADHEFATPDGWRRLDALAPGDEVLTNGTPVCGTCGSSEGVAISDQAKYKGHCRKCIYSTLRTDGNYKRGWFKDDDGYIRVSGMKGHPRAGKAGTVYQHILVMEQSIGRYVRISEAVHHKNEIRDDNRIENLELMTVSGHAKEHSPEKMKHLNRDKHGNEIIWTARVDRVESITYYGEEDVYDLVMADPHRNFVANGMIVHNCGKTFEAALWARCFNRAFHAQVIVICPVSLKPTWMEESRSCGVPMSIHSWASVPTAPDKPFVLICDEAHYSQGGDGTLRGKAMIALATSPNCMNALMVSGTPMRGGRPENIYPLLKAIKHPISKDKRTYDDYWSNNVKSLMAQIAPVYLRRTKDQVLKDLPSKIVTIRNVTPSPAALKLYNEAFSEARARYEIERDARVEAQCEATGADYRAGMKEGAEALVLLGILRKAASIGKVEGAIEIADEVLEQGRKIIIFTEFTNSATALAAHYRKQGVQAELLTGAVNPEERPRMVERFQRGPSRVWVSTIKAGGVGLTLTAADTVVLLDQSWMIDDCRQAEDRAHRQDAIMNARIKSGNAGCVSVYWLRGFEIDSIIQKRLAEQAQALKDVESGAASNTRSVKSINQMAAEVAREMFKREKTL